ncbi:hypothetical protein ACFV0T_18520 [Streptomyces sp. NPDC059582]|uniref:hypothetical protein n=1 Tax=Streptomyces sp. NPDC059582 TaxID=3346875 RepID=UPI0036C97A91
MKRPGPLFTLLAGLLLGLFLLSLNATTGARNPSSANQREAPAPAAAETGLSPSPTPSPSASPSPSRTPVPDASYAGRTDDDTAAVAVTVRDGRAIAYFCDGHDKESWLKGDVQDDGTLRLTGGHGARLDGTLAENRRIRGTVDIDGGHYAFTADRARKPSGLYRATATVRGARVDGGWIVLPDGRQVGVLTRDGAPGAAPAIDPETGAVTVDGQQLTAGPAIP